MNKQELSAASAIGLLYLIRMLGLFMVLPVLPLVTDDVALATPLLIGVAIGIYGLSQAALQIPFGLLSDRIGRKPVIALGLGLFVLGSVIAGMSEDIYGLILGRFLQGCGAIASALLALMSDLTRIDQRAKSMAIIGISIAGSFGLSLILGPLVAEAFGLSGIFNLSGLLGLVGLVLLFMVIPTPTVMANNLDSSVQTGSLKKVLADNGLWRINISIFCLHFLLVSAFSVFPLIFEQTGVIETSEHALYYLGLLVISLVLMTPLMWMSDRMNDVRPILVTTVALFLLAFFILSATSAYLIVLFGMVIFFVCFNLLEVVLPAQVGRLSAAGTRGTAMGVYTTCQFLGIFAGGVGSGLILQLGDIRAVMYADMALVFLWLLICVSLRPHGEMGSRTVSLAELQKLSPTQRAEALLSIDGVIDAVIIESDQVAYLKVDETRFSDEQLKQVVGWSGT